MDEMTLEEFFRRYPRVAVALSGGVDSSYLLYAAVQAGAEARAYFVQTAFQPQFERADAERLASELSVPLTVVEVDILSDPAVASNPADRCYHCKRRLFAAVRERAAADGFAVLLDGTNASDDAGDRPGMRALNELNVFSPLRLCGIGKDELRRRAKEAGLFLWAKPAYACLATRIPTGEPIARETLARVEGAEAALGKLGFSDLRVRVFHGAARVQLPAGQLARAAERADELRLALAPYFETVLLDLAGR